MGAIIKFKKALQNIKLLFLTMAKVAERVFQISQPQRHRCSSTCKIFKEFPFRSLDELMINFWCQ